MNKIDLNDLMLNRIDPEIENFCEALINKLKHHASLGRAYYDIRLSGKEYNLLHNGIMGCRYFWSDLTYNDRYVIKSYIKSKIKNIDVIFDVNDSIIFVW